ncbi:MAG TPA: hypothetical protein VKR38_15075 [Usitatibacter sp.]|nr:hypothetical protein [Usitatibacter sp.]
MSIHTIQFGDEGQSATRELSRMVESLAAFHFGAFGTVRDHVATLESLDRQYGGSAELPAEDVDTVVAALHTELARWEAGATRRKLAAHDAIDSATIGVALWAMRHGVEITVVEPVVNALARRSNQAKGKQEAAAAFALMQGVIAHVSPRLSADLERSNPERPWRLLHANLAITAIRTEDPAMIAFAFDALDAALPDERATFYAEARALALAPGISPHVRSLIEARLPL